MNTDPRLVKLQKLLEVANGGLDKEDFVKSFEQVLTFVRALSERLTADISMRANAADMQIQHQLRTIEQMHQDVKTSTDANFAALKARSMEGMTALLDKTSLHDRVNADMKATLSDHEAKMGALTAQLATMPSKIMDMLPQEKEETPDDIRNKLETLAGTERLKASAIEGLDDLEPRLQEIDRKASRVQTPAKSYQIHTKDASAQCDGNNRSFTVGGSHFGIIGVFSTQDPKVFLPVIDYTQTQTGITMSSAIPAIVSGQSLIILYLQ